MTHASYLALHGPYKYFEENLFWLNSATKPSTAPYAILLKLTNSEQEHGKNNTTFNKDTNREAISA